ncbi:hypothetical protein [Thermus thermophilus]|uniref:hypothetical protein n=1 Tax=Thermus thermophilus TaxID=274 RepID=UPI001FCB84DD|nr:hypothetical protein [Thermus thermophilus]
MPWEYKVYPLPRDFALPKRKDQTPEQAVSQAMERLLNEMAVEGWEYYRTETVNISELPGCLGSLLGQKEVTRSFNFIVFRRPRSSS